MAFTPGWTKKLGRDAQLCRTVAEHREEGTTRPVLCARCRPHDNAVLIITPKRRKTVTPLLQRSGLRAQRRRLVRDPESGRNHQLRLCGILKKGRNSRMTRREDGIQL